MSTEIIFAFAIGVFVLMCAGIFMTMVEFNRMTDDPSIRKDAEVRPEPGTPETAGLRLVQRDHQDAA